MKKETAIISRQALKENGISEVVVREGAAEILREKVKLNIKGTIDAPGKFIEKRKGEYEKLKCHVLYSLNEGYIRLQVDEDSYYGSYIEGKLNLNPEYVAFGINDPNKTYTTIELQKFLKLRRIYFPDKEKCAQIVGNLERFKIKTTSDIDKSNDGRGNKIDSYSTTAKTDLAFDFDLEMPLYIGQPAKKFKVQIGFDVREKDITLWLESVESREIELSDKFTLIIAELENFKDYVIIEQ